jgi:hypothetical protein
MKTKRPPGTLGGTFDEMREGTWRANARRRASRRKSAWNLLLPVTIIPLFIILWAVAATLLQVVGLLAGMKPSGSHMSLVRFLMIFPLIIPAITGACVVGNFVIYRIGPARRAMEAEDQGFPGTDYATAQKALSKATWMSLSVALVLALIGIAISR